MGVNTKFHFTYSDDHKLALFLPGKTGTVHATFILNHFNFKTNIHEANSEKIISEDDYVIHHHDEILPKCFEGYDAIYTTRNPYTRLISMYYHYKRMEESKGVFTKTFKEDFVEKINKGWFHSNSGFKFVKKPKYFLRMEHLYHDYTQIPFIRNSKFNRSGLLYEFCNKKIHSKKQEIKSLTEYYTQDMADYLYKTIKPYFDLVGYDKDSWR